MKVFAILFTTLLLVSAALLCSCLTLPGTGDPGTSDNPGEQTPPDPVDPVQLNIFEHLSNYKIVYPNGNENAKAAAEKLASSLAAVDTANEIPVVTDDTVTDTDYYIITVGDATVGDDYGTKERKNIKNGSNGFYGAFCVTYDEYHIYILADSDESLDPAIEFFKVNYLKSGDVTIPGPDAEVEVVHHFSRDNFKKAGIKSALVKTDYLKGLTSIKNFKVKEGAEYLYFSESADGYSFVLAEGARRPSFTCEAESPLSTLKIGSFSGGVQTITVTAANGTVKKYRVEFLTLDMTYATDFSEETLAVAMSIPNITFNNGKGNWPQEMNGASALITLALHEYYHPGSEVNGKLVSERIYEHLSNVIVGGREPQMYVGPYWANPTFASSVALAKKTPSVWSRLNAAEIERYDWIMRTYAVTVNFASNAQNNFLTGPELKGNFNKGWNPNFQSSNLLQIGACVSYFGSAAEVNDILTSFSYDEYIAKFRELNYSNILENWTEGDKQNGAGFVKRLLEDGAGTESSPFTYKDSSGAVQSGGYGVGAKIPFTYAAKGVSGTIPLSNVSEILNAQIKALYARPCTSTIFEAHIDGNQLSPYEGQVGMMAEYDTSDAKGYRSSASYCDHNFAIMVSNTSAFVALGLWNPSATGNKTNCERMFIGNEDHVFKKTEGYWSYMHGALGATPDKEQPGEVSVYTMTKAIWQEYLINFVNNGK